jgi:hypothetical protein
MGPSVIHLLGPLKKHTDGKKFATDADVKKAVTSFLNTTDAEFFYTRVQTSVPLRQIFKRFATDVDVNKAVTSFLHTTDAEFVCTRIQNSVPL